MHWVWLIIVGAIVGALGRLFHPGRDPMGFIVTTLIGIAALVIAGAIFSNGVLEFVVGIIARILFGTAGGFIFAFVGAVLLLYVYRRVVQHRGLTGPSARRLPPRV